MESEITAPAATGPQVITTGAQAASTSTGPKFRALLFSLTPVDVLQLICMQRATCLLDIQSTMGSKGSIVVKRGTIIYASADEMTGLLALACVLSWDSAEIIESDKVDESLVQNINMDWESALMAAAQLSDEFAAGVPGDILTEVQF